MRRNVFVSAAPAGCLSLCCAVHGQAPAEAGPAPSGVLSGKVVYVHAGHGWTADNLGSGSWTTQRGETNEIVEDLNNSDLMVGLVDRLWRAGATVVPLRPVGQQTSEVVLDNDDAGVSFSSGWFESGAALHFGAPGDAPYRFATTSEMESAVATFRPTLPEAGRYPVYSWVTHGANRVEQLYRVQHAGGVTEVRVDHRMVGNGLVYLGTYSFEAGDAGYIEISNQSDDFGVVVADMVRFGNGMGDIDRGGGVSGYSRADEAGLYWVRWHAERSQGVPESVYQTSSSDGNSTINLAPAWAAYMNREQAGTLADRVLVSYHTNAFDGTARGTIGLWNTSSTRQTPNQFELAFLLASEVTDDLVAQNGDFEHAWFDRGGGITLGSSFGEINNQFINDEFDATIVEVGFHDNVLDAQLLRDATVQDAVNRSMVQGLVRYFDLVGPSPVAFPPAEPGNAYAVANTDGSVAVGWSAPGSGPVLGDAAAGYRVQTSADGDAFDYGVVVAGGSATSAVITGLPAGPRYFRVVATNDAGESRPTPVVGCAVGEGPSRVLVVDGFERLDRRQNPRRAYLGGTIDRVQPEWSNSFDYTPNVGGAISSARPGVGFDSADNGAVVGGTVDLSDYDFVVWYTGEESIDDRTFDFDEQPLASAFVNAGGDLMVSGAEIAWDLDNFGNGLFFYNSTLSAEYLADDAATYDVFGEPGSVFDGLLLSFDDGSRYFDAEFPDVVGPLGTASVAMRYSGGLGGPAAVVRPAVGPLSDVIVLGFPFITITDDLIRADTMDRVLSFVGIAACVGDVTTTNTNPGDTGYGVPDGSADGADLSYFVERWLAGSAEGDVTTSNTNPGDAGYGSSDGTVDGADLSYFVEQWLAGCP